MPRRKRFQKGRMVNGEFIGPGSVDRSLGSGKRDDVPALLTAGEYVVRKETVDLVGEEYLNKLNATGVGRGFEPNELASPARFNRGGRVRTGYQNGNLVTSNNGRKKMPQTRGLRRMARPGRGRTRVAGKQAGVAGKARYAAGGSAGINPRMNTRRVTRAAGGSAGINPRMNTRRVTRKNGGRMVSRMSRPGGKAGLRGRGFQTFKNGGSVQKASFANESLMTNNRSLVELPPDRTDMIGSGWRGKRR